MRMRYLVGEIVVVVVGLWFELCLLCISCMYFGFVGFVVMGVFVKFYWE